MSLQPKHVYEFDSYRLDATEHILWHDGKTVPLQPKVFDLLLVLVEHHGHLLEKDKLMRLIWHDTVVEEANLVNNISILRKVLGPNGQQFIETVPKLGYRFVSEVRAVEEKSTEIGEESNAETVEAGKRMALPSTTKYNLTQIRGLGYVLAVFLIVFSIAGYFWIRQIRKDTTFRESFNEMQIRRLTSTGRAFEAALSPDGQLVGYIVSSTVFGGYPSLWIKQLTTNQETQLLSETGLRYRGLAFSPDGNFIYYSQRSGQETQYYLHRIAILGGKPQKLFAGVDSAVSFSPDGSQLVFVRENEAAGESVLMISNADGTKERRIAVCKSPESYSVDGPSWSADGKMIAVAKMVPAPDFHFRIMTIRVKDGMEQSLGKTNWAWLMRVAWLKDGSGLATVGRIKSGGSNNQIWRVTYPDGGLHRITNDLNGYRNLNLTPDADKLITVQSEIRSNLWVIEVENPKTAMPITHDPISQNGYKGLDWTPDGKVVYTSLANGHQNLWVTNADGSQARQLTADSDDTDHFPAVSNDGMHIVFSSSRSGPGRIWRVDRDGSNLIELTSGKHDLKPSYSPDGNWIVYSSDRNGKRVIVKKSAHNVTSEAIALTDNWADFPVISPSNELIACLYQDSISTPRKIALVPLIGGAPIKVLNLPNTHPWPSVRWVPDGQSLSYLDPKEDSTNVWRFPLNGGEPNKLTDFHEEQIFAYAWSRDGRFLACARGTIQRDVVLINQFR